MRTRFARWGVAPAAFINLALFAIPMVLMLGLSFWSTRDFALIREWTLDNYRALARDGAILRVFLRTFWMSAVITAGAVAFAYPFAYFLVRHTRKWQQALLLLVVVSFWTSSVLRAYTWMVILGERGVLNGALMGLGLISQPLGFFLYNKFAVIIVGVYFLAPFAVLILYSAVERMDPNQVIAALDLGASPWQAFLYITLPQTRAGLYAAAFFCFVNSLGFFVVPALVGGTDSVMVANVVGTLFHSGQLARGAAASLALAVVVFGLLRAARRYADFERV